MKRKVTNSSMLRQKITTEIQYSQRPLYGRLCNRMDTIPVPMVTLNHDGVKLRTILRHPWLLRS